MTTALPVETRDLAAVEAQCSSIDSWATQCESVPELRDASHKLAATDEYLSRTLTEGKARVTVAMRRLEVRIGELLPNEQGRHTDLDLLGHEQEVDLDARQRHGFCKMAAHPDIVEDEIVGSNYAKPASRRPAHGDFSSSLSVNVDRIEAVL